MTRLIKPESIQDSNVQGTFEFYTVEETGESGMSQSGLAALCGVTRQSIILLEKTLVSKSPSEWLEPLVGRRLTLVSSQEESEIKVNGKQVGNIKIYNAEFCGLTIQHYANQGNPVALNSASQFTVIGVNAWIQSITGWQGRDREPYIPYWYKRIRLFTAKTRIPDNWWCVFEELVRLMMDLESYGYALPDISPTTGKKITPDISIGKMFCKYMRDKGYDVDGIVRKYPHHYPDERGVQSANIYPVDWLPEFNKWFNETWKRERLLDYLGSRDPEALPSIHKLLGLPEAEDNPKLEE